MATEKPHAESLLNIPLVRQALSDPCFSIRPRAIDRSWSYSRALDVSVNGFNPTFGTAFYGSKSALSEWLKNPSQPARQWNRSDFLVREVLFLVHDYLHCWAYSAINDLLPRIGLGWAPITQRNFEDLVFCHLLTETVATVGLDYWYLSVHELNKICNLGTNQSVLTVSYHESMRSEFRKFNPRLEVQDQAFFKSLARFYCTGLFMGFSTADVVRSPQLHLWLNKELFYGQTQREYTRIWLRYLSSGKLQVNANDLGAAVSVSEKWKKNLIHDLGELLWEKIKKDKLLSFRAVHERDSWKAPKDKYVDFRFLNLNKLDFGRAGLRIPGWPNSDINFRFFFNQYVSQFEFSKFDVELVKLFGTLIQKKDFPLLQAIFKDQKPIQGSFKEPRDLFFPN